MVFNLTLSGTSEFVVGEDYVAVFLIVKLFEFEQNSRIYKFRCYCSINYYSYSMTIVNSLLLSNLIITRTIIVRNYSVTTRIINR